jgi:N-acetylglucosaminyldiphosphoundecaprenol N-acetyl-beta-D-mannosaminyltransferase
MPLLAVGAAFNFHAGLLAQAPGFMQRNGLEWLYRLVREPRRLWKRYLLLNPLYATLVALQLCGLRTVDPKTATPPAHEILYG